MTVWEGGEPQPLPHDAREQAELDRGWEERPSPEDLADMKRLREALAAEARGERLRA